MATLVDPLASALDLAVVRLRDAGGRVVGAGFLVGPREILTCAHVVAAALGDTSAQAALQDVEVHLDFPLVEPTGIRTAKVTVWRPPEAEGASDIAGLALTSPPPQGAKPARLVAARDVWEHAFRVLGFPARLDEGVWATGRLRGRQAGGWVQLEAIRETGYRIERGFSGTPVWDEELDGVVGMAVAADAQAERRAAYLIPTSALLDAWPMLSVRAIPPCPYRGLFAFREEDAPRFFGREEISDQLVADIARSRLVGVVGPSGSGKSSLIFAGVVPRIRQLDGWTVADLRPGKAAAPLIALASALLPLLEPTMTEIDRLRELPKLAGVLAERRLMEVVDRGLERVGADRLLLIVDQFEELFIQQPAVAAEFIDVLLRALAAQQPRTHPTLTIVLTLRADFLGQALEHPALAKALQGDVLVIGSMTREQLQRVVEGPVAGEVVYEAGLVDRILDDVGSEPGNLPLLEFALTLLWQQQVARTLTHAAYEALGEVDGALARYAETVYLGELPEAEQEAARRVFVQLVRPGEATDHLRRVAHRGELDDERWRVAQRLAATRLVVTGRDPAGAETIEVVHEALISRWDRLRDWVEADRAFRSWQERLRTTIRQWEASGHDSGALLRGVALAEAERWLKQQPGDISPTERGFVQTSRAFQARTLRRLRGLAAMLAVLLLITAVLGSVAWGQRGLAIQQRRRAEQQNELAVSRALANEAGDRFLGQADLSMLLSVAAFRIADTREAREALQGELELRRDTKALLVGHTAAVFSSVFSPDGRTLASASRDGTIGLWDVPHHRLIKRLDGRGGTVITVAFSRDGRTLAAANEDGTIGLWDVARRTRFGSLRTHVHPHTVAFSPDGGMLAAGSEDGTLAFWDTHHLRDVTAIHEIASLPAHQGEVLDLAFSPDGHTLASASADKTVRLWEVVSGANLAPITSLVGHTDWVNSVAFSRDGNTLASASDDGTIRLWDVASRQQTATLEGHLGGVTSAAFSRDGRILASASADETIRLWDVASRKQIALLIGHIGPVTDVSFSPDGRTLASASVDKTVILWDANPRDNLGYVELAHDVAFSPDSQTLAVASDDKEILLWDVPRRRLAARLKGYAGAVYGVAFSRDGRTLASASADKTITLWDVARRTRSRSLHIDATPLSVAFSPAGGMLAAGSDDGTLRLWNIKSGNQIASLPAHRREVLALAFSSDGHTLASAGADRTIRLWDVARPAKVVRIRNLVGHTDRVNGVAFSPNGHTLASASDDTTVRLWDIAKPKPTATLVGHAHEVTDVAFSPDGRTLASASGDAILLWDVATHARSSGFESSFDRFSTGDDESRLAFSPDGRLLATNDFGAIVLHSLDIQEWARHLCEVVGHDLTKTEWDEFVPGREYRTVCD